MSEFLILIAAEARKLRRTLALGLTLAAPAVVVALYFVYLLNVAPGRWPRDGQAWLTFTRMCIGLWSFLMLPLCICLVTALLNGVEHANHQWKHLFALPVARWRVYLAKLAVASALVAASFFLLLPLVIAGGWTAQAVRPWLGFGLVPVAAIAALLAKTLLASTLLIAIHHQVSFRWPSMTLALGLGIVGTVGSFVVVNSERWGRYFPWSMPTRVSSGHDPRAGLVLLLSLAGAVLVAAWGSRGAERREPTA